MPENPQTKRIFEQKWLPTCVRSAKKVLKAARRGMPAKMLENTEGADVFALHKIVEQKSQEDRITVHIRTQDPGYDLHPKENDIDPPKDRVKKDNLTGNEIARMQEW